MYEYQNFDSVLAVPSQRKTYLPKCFTTSMKGYLRALCPGGIRRLFFEGRVGSVGATWGEHWLPCRVFSTNKRGAVLLRFRLFFLYLSLCNFSTQGDLADLPPRIFLLGAQHVFSYFTQNLL